MLKTRPLFSLKTLSLFILTIALAGHISGAEATSEKSTNPCGYCPKSMTKCIDNKCSYDREFSVNIVSTVDKVYCGASDFPNKGSTSSRCFGTGPSAIGPINKNGKAVVSLPTGCLLQHKPVVTVLCSQGMYGNPTCLNKLNPPIKGKTYVYPRDFKACNF